MTREQMVPFLKNPAKQIDFMRISYLKASGLLLIIFMIVSCQQKNKSDSPATSTKNAQVKKENDSIESNTKKPDTTINDQANTHVSNELDFLAELNGKYPYDVKLLDQPVLKKRLQKMLGVKYRFLKSIWQVETPIEVDNNVLYAWAMQTHSGGDPSAVIMADISKGVLYAGIRENGKTKIYSEDGSEAPKKLQDWSKEN